jgi:DNA-binding response OmpR family regulator
MKVLVAGGATVELEPYAESAREAGHVARVVSDLVLPSACHDEKPGLVVVDVPRETEASLELLRKVRDVAVTPLPLVFVLVGPDVSNDFLVRAYECGVDGEVRRPFSFGYFAARVGAAARLARRGDQAGAVRGATSAPGKTRSTVGVPPPVATPAPDQGTAHVNAATESSTWKRAAALIQDTASRFLALPVVVSPETGGVTASLGCAISLSHATYQLEARIAIGAEMKSARKLAMHLFGEEGDDLMGDMLNELANLFMGALKTSFSSENFAFTGGLPETVSPDYVVRPTATYKHQETFVLGIDDSRLLIYLGMRSKANTMLTAAGLREGMVVAKDVFNARGVMLVTSGTRLSLNMVEKLKQLLTPKHMVEVTVP